MKREKRDQRLIREKVQVQVSSSSSKRVAGKRHGSTSRVELELDT